MIPEGGYIKVHRKLLNDPWFREAGRMLPWLDLMAAGAWAAHETGIYRGTVRLQRGEFVAPVRALAERWDWKVSRVHRFLSDLVARESIEHVRTVGGTKVYRMPKYDEYQGSDPVRQPDFAPQSRIIKPVAPQRVRSGVRKSREASIEASVEASVEASKPNDTNQLDWVAEASIEASVEAPVEANKKTSKSSRKKEITDAGASGRPSPLDAFPKDACDRLYETWTATWGVVAYSRFRKALAPLFPAGGPRYSVPLLAKTIGIARDICEIEDPFALKRPSPEVVWLGRLVEWARLAEMEPTDDTGRLTELGRRLAGIK